MSKSNAIPIASLSLLLLAFFYFLAISTDPRMADGGLNGNEMTLGETIFTLLVPLSVFAAMFVAMRRAYYSGSKFWFFVCFVLWPATFIYTLVVNRTDVL